MSKKGICSSIIANGLSLATDPARFIAIISTSNSRCYRSSLLSETGDVIAEGLLRTEDRISDLSLDRIDDLFASLLSVCLTKIKAPGLNSVL